MPTKNISAPRSVKRAKAKGKIFEAAMQLLQEYGYDYITVSNVCEMAGISTGNFYHYFESKDELLSNFFIVAYEQEMQGVDAVETESPLADAVAPFKAYASFCQKQGLQFVSNFYQPTNTALAISPAHDAGTTFALPVLHHAEQALNRAVAKRILAADVNTAQITEDLCVLQKGCVFDWCVNEGRFDLVEHTEKLLSQYLESFQS